MKITLEEFLYQCQHHSGCRRGKYLENIIACPKTLTLLPSMEEMVNIYMQVAHKKYHENKTWKSYDW